MKCFVHLVRPKYVVYGILNVGPFYAFGEKIVDVHRSMFDEALLLRVLWYLNV